MTIFSKEQKFEIWNIFKKFVDKETGEEDQTQIEQLIKELASKKSVAVKLFIDEIEEQKKERLTVSDITGDDYTYEDVLSEIAEKNIQSDSFELIPMIFDTASRSLTVFMPDDFTREELEENILDLCEKHFISNGSPDADFLIAQIVSLWGRCLSKDKEELKELIALIRKLYDVPVNDMENTIELLKAKVQGIIK